MAVQCPQCNTDSNEDFGMVTCAKCGNIFLVDINGDVQAPSEELPQQEDNFYAEPEPEEFLNPLEEEQIEPTALHDIPSPEQYVVELDPSPIEEHSSLGDKESHKFDVPDEDFSQSEIVNQDFTDRDLFSSDEKIDVQEAELHTESVDQEHDVVVNNQVTNQKNSLIVDRQPQSAFVYDILIEGIETAEDRVSLLEALEDSRMNLFRKDVMEAIVGSALLLAQVVPVKATLILQRISALNFVISWRQYDVSEIQTDFDYSSVDDLGATDTGQEGFGVE